MSRQTDQKYLLNYLFFCYCTSVRGAYQRQFRKCACFPIDLYRQKGPSFDPEKEYILMWSMTTKTLQKYHTGAKFNHFIMLFMD